MTNIFTIGYEGAELSAFLKRLQAEGVDVVIDVRELPLSRRKGFSKQALADALRGRGIQYIHRRELGAPKTLRNQLRETGDLKTYFKGFNAYLGTQRAALEQISREIRGSVALLCFEREPLECHRSAVARELGQLTDVQPVHLRMGGQGGSIRETSALHPRQGVSAA